MGATYVDVTIRNPAAPERTWTGPFLVGTGAFDSLVPRSRLEAIGLLPRGSREYTLADGQRIALDITIAELEFEGERVGGTVVYGEEGAEPLLGRKAPRRALDLWLPGTTQKPPTPGPVSLKFQEPITNPDNMRLSRNA